MKTHSRTHVAILAALTTLAALAWQAPAAADPPSWAPAYGARDHDGHESWHEEREELKGTMAAMITVVTTVTTGVMTTAW